MTSRLRWSWPLVVTGLVCAALLGCYGRADRSVDQPRADGGASCRGRTCRDAAVTDAGSRGDGAVRDAGLDAAVLRSEDAGPAPTADAGPTVGAGMDGEAAVPSDAGTYDAGPPAPLEPPVDAGCPTVTTHARLTECSIVAAMPGCMGPSIVIATGLDDDDDGRLAASEADTTFDACRFEDSCDPQVGVPPLCELPGVDLHDRALGTRVIMADLRGADLSGSECGEPSSELGNDCQLACSNLRGANLTGALLSRPRLGAADLSDADLSGARLRGGLFSNVAAVNARFGAANLSGADLRGANVSGADLSGADLQDAKTVELTACPAALPDDAWVCREIVRAACDQPGPRSFVLLGPHVDLSGSDLSGQDLRGVALRDASLSAAELDSADLREADLERADLVGTSLVGASLAGAKVLAMRAIDLVSCPAVRPNADWSCRLQPLTGRFVLVGPGARLSNGWAAGGGAQPPRGDVSEVDFSGAHMAGADLMGVIAKDARFAGADLAGADCSEMNMAGVGLQRARLVGARLDVTYAPGADLTGADLTSAKLQFATFTGADLSHSTMREAALHGTNLTGANLAGADLAGAMLFRTRAAELIACPAVLPSADYSCIAQSGGGRFELIGPGTEP